MRPNANGEVDSVRRPRALLVSGVGLCNNGSESTKARESWTKGAVGLNDSHSNRLLTDW